MGLVKTAKETGVELSLCTAVGALMQTKQLIEIRVRPVLSNGECVLVVVGLCGLLLYSRPCQLCHLPADMARVEAV